MLLSSLESTECLFERAQIRGLALAALLCVLIVGHKDTVEIQERRQLKMLKTNATHARARAKVTIRAAKPETCSRFHNHAQ